MPIESEPMLSAGRPIGELLVPKHVLQQLRKEGSEAVEANADAQIQCLLDDVLEKSSVMVDIPSEDGARHITSAIFLVRACEFLREYWAATKAPTLQIIGLRSAFELAVVGRFLIAHPDGPDEFRRLFQQDMKSEVQTSKYFNTTSADPPEFLKHLMMTDQKAARDLASMALALDVIDGWEPSVMFSATYTWRLCHKFVSQSCTHANAVSTKRFTNGEGGILGIHPTPPPVFDGPPHLLVACFVAELADAVYDVLKVPKGRLPHQISRPLPDYEKPEG